MRRAFVAAVIACAACDLALSNLDNGKLAGPVASAPDSAADVVTPPSTIDSGADASDAAVIDTYRAAVLADHPDGYWRLAEPANAITAKDEVGAHDGAYVSVANGVPGPLTGRVAASFDGQTSRIELPNAFDYAGTDPWSIEAWASTNENVVGCHHIFTREERDSVHRGFAMLQYSDAGVYVERFEASMGNGSQDQTKAILQTKVFAHVVGTYDGLAMRFYLNGELVSTGSADTRALDDFVIGPFIGAAGVGDCVWSGALAEVAVYPTALGPAQVAAHYAARF